LRKQCDSNNEKSHRKYNKNHKHSSFTLVGKHLVGRADLHNINLGWDNRNHEASTLILYRV
jgi:hypothetical protein